MRKKHFAVLALAALLVALPACNLPINPLAALGLSTATPAGLAVTGGTGTPTPTVPQLSVTSATPCRMGPGKAYDLVFTANPGADYTVVGQYNRGGYWIIANPLGGSCWLSAQNAVVSGSTVGLPAYPAPALEEPTTMPRPTALGNLFASRTCTAGVRGTTPIWIEGVSLSWNPSHGETGYQVFRDGTQIFTLPAGALNYDVVIRYDQGGSGPLFDSFGVQAFNSSGTSPRSSVTIARCP